MQEPAVVEELIDLYINFLLNQPLHSIINSTDLTKSIVAGMKSMAGDPKNEAWLIELIASGLKQVKKQKKKGAVKDLFPPKAIEACQQLAQCPVSLSKSTATALVDHAVVKTFLRYILTNSILEFSQQFAAHLPGGKVVSGLMGMARDIASSRLGGVGINIEQKAKSFVEEALSPSLKVVADLLADDGHAAGLADWRRHILGVVVNLSFQEFVAMFAKVDEEKLASQIAVLCRSVALWDKLSPTIQTFLDEAIKQVGDRSIRSTIAGTSLEKEWRSLIARQFSSIVGTFFADAQFAGWLEKHS